MTHDADGDRLCPWSLRFESLQLERRFWDLKFLRTWDRYALEFALLNLVRGSARRLPRARARAPPHRIAARAPAARPST
jgi:hypothetical protein